MLEQGRKRKRAAAGAGFRQGIEKIGRKSFVAGGEWSSSISWIFHQYP
jgi:hypothetical protein